VGVQADTVVPEALNRYSYVLNNPLKYIDASGYRVEQSAGIGGPRWESEWVERYKAAHGGAEPTEQDWQDYLLSQRYPGTGPGGGWTEGDWRIYSQVRGLLGDLLREIGEPGGWGAGIYTYVGRVLVHWRNAPVEPFADGTWLATSGNMPLGAVWPVHPGWTLGDVIIVIPGVSEEEKRVLLVHEFVHVLQYRAGGAWFVADYVREGPFDPETNAYEMQALAVDALLRENLWLPPIWTFPWAGERLERTSPQQ
jgi:hypothetical protein